MKTRNIIRSKKWFIERIGLKIWNDMPNQSSLCLIDEKHALLMHSKQKEYNKYRFSDFNEAFPDKRNDLMLHMVKMNKIRVEIIDELKKSYPAKSDLSDLGNIIGIVIGKYLSKEIGFEKEDFIHGIKHGLSISDGTHDKKK